MLGGDEKFILVTIKRTETGHCLEKVAVTLGKTLQNKGSYNSSTGMTSHTFAQSTILN